MGDLGSLAKLQGRHVHARDRERDVGPEADELPRSLPHL